MLSDLASAGNVEALALTLAIMRRVEYRKEKSVSDDLGGREVEGEEKSCRRRGTGEGKGRRGC